MVGKSLNLPNFSWRSFRYAILATRGLGKVKGESLFYHYSGVPVVVFGDFCNFVRPNGTLGGFNWSQP